MGDYCASGKPFVLVVVSWPGLLNIFDNLNVIVNIIGQINECLSSEVWVLSSVRNTDTLKTFDMVRCDLLFGLNTWKLSPIMIGLESRHHGTMNMVITMSYVLMMSHFFINLYGIQWQAIQCTEGIRDRMLYWPWIYMVPGLCRWP